MTKIFLLDWNTYWLIYLLGNCLSHVLQTVQKNKNCWGQLEGTVILNKSLFLIKKVNIFILIGFYSDLVKTWPLLYGRTSLKKDSL